MQSQSGFAEVNGTRLFYTVEGAGQPLVLIHGFSLDTRMWATQVETLSQQYRVVRYDLRGFGKSAFPGNKAYEHAADLKALLAFLGIEQAIIIGLSLGGMVAVDFALVYPKQVRTLVLVDALYTGYQWSEDWKTSIDRVWKAGKDESIAAAKRLWLGHPLFQATLEQPTTARELIQIVEDYSGWHFVNDNPAISLDPMASQHLSRIISPTLALVGERDLPDFHRMADAVQQQVHRACKVVLPNVGHMANMDDPILFNHTILDFLQKH